MLRWILTSLFLILSVIVTLLAFYERGNSMWSALWLNLGTEIFGIVITVSLVEWLFERRRLREQAVKMAWRIVHDIDHVVWVWQGGRRGFDLDELIWLLEHVRADDPLPEFTQNLLMRIGSQSEHTLLHDVALVKSARMLEPALVRLAGLAAVRDSTAPLAANAIAVILLDALHCLAWVIRRPVPVGAATAGVEADSSIPQQQWRHYGTPPESRSNAASP